MNKILKSVIGCVAGLLAAPVVFGATTAMTSPTMSDTTSNGTVVTPANTENMVAAPASTVTVTKTGPMGYNVCYRPTSRNVQSSRIVQRCGYNGCQNFRVTRSFNVTVYENCHLQVNSCSSNGFVRFGFYPTKQDAHYAIDRCQHTVGGQIPHDWQVQH